MAAGECQRTATPHNAHPHHSTVRHPRPTSLPRPAHRRPPVRLRSVVPHAPSAERAVETASGLYIDGAWRAGDGVLGVTDPSTGAKVGEVVAATPEDARSAVAAAHAAFPAWSACS